MTPKQKSTSKLIEKIHRMARAGNSIRAAASEAKCSFDTASKHWPSDVPRPAAKKSLKDTPEGRMNLERQKTTEDAARREHVSAVKELVFREFLAKLVKDQIKPLEPLAPPAALMPAKSHKRSALLTLTDWHFEERVKSAAVLDLNSYSIEDACRRVYRVTRAACDWRRDMEAGGRFAVTDLTVALMGDFLTGTLHGLERHTDAPNVVRAALACGDLISLALRDLASQFRTVNVVGVVGNHGRLPDDRKVPTKDPTRSWDYLAYQVAKRRLEGTRNIKFELPESYGCLFKVGGHLCYTSHGNFIPNNLGVVGYGIRRFTSALASNLTAAGKSLKYCFFGHWHQNNAAEFAGIQAFICPSLIGTQEYSFLSGGAVNRPAQSLFVFDKTLGIVSQETIYADGPGYPGAYKIEV